MGLHEQDAQRFSELDAEKRIVLLMEHIKLLQNMRQDKPKNSMDNVDVNVALKKAYILLEKEFGI